MIFPPEQCHDDDVGNVGGQVHVGQTAVIGTNVADEEKWDEHEPAI